MFSPIIVFWRDTALPTHDFILLKKNVIGVQLIYNIVLVSSVQQSKLVIHIYIYIYVEIGYYRVLSRVPCAVR